MNRTDPPIPLPQKLELLSIDCLHPSDRNPRLHPIGNVEKIKASMRTYGWTVPVLIDGDSNVIAGHGRLLAARQLGLNQVPVIRLENLSPQLAEAYRIADNRLTLDSDWDNELLATVLKDLQQSDLPLSVTGFDEQELVQLLGQSLEGDLYGGMPEFSNENQGAYKQLVVNFSDQAGLDEFARLVGQTINFKTTYIWFPKVARSPWMNQSYEAPPQEE